MVDFERLLRKGELQVFCDALLQRYLVQRDGGRSGWSDMWLSEILEGLQDSVKHVDSVDLSHTNPDVVVKHIEDMGLWAFFLFTQYQNKVKGLYKE